MTSLKNITILIESTSIVPYNTNNQAVPIRQTFECGQLAAELQELSSARVTIVENDLQAVLTAEFILLYTSNFEDILNKYWLTLEQTLLERIVLIDLFSDKDKLFNLLHRYQLAAAVGSKVYFSWMARGQIPGLDGLYGLTSIAKEIDAEFRLEETEHYCNMKDIPFISLPALLIRYLQVYLKRIILKEDDAPSLDTLLSTLKQAKPMERREVALALSRIPDTQAVDTLLELLKDSDWVVRSTAVRGLTQYAQAFELPFDLRPILGQVLDTESHQVAKELTARWLTDYANKFSLDVRPILCRAIIQSTTTKTTSMILMYLWDHAETLDLDFRPFLNQIISEVRDEDIRSLASTWLNREERLID